MPPPITLVIATRNKGKCAEIRELLEGYPVTIKDLTDFGPIPAVVEDGLSFDENAYKKASFTARVLGLPALADDSGLVVAALGGMAGESLLCEAKRPLIAQSIEPKTATASFAMRDARYKMTFVPSTAGGTFEMFRLSSDPLELDNVFGHQGHLRKKWQVQLRQAAAALVGAR